MPEKKISFVLPGGGKSGGVMNTILMANLLINKGYSLRVLVKREPLIEKLKKMIKKLMHFFLKHEDDWLKDFVGQIEIYGDINKVHFEINEIVVAQGAYTVEDVFSIRNTQIIKLRFCRGFSSFKRELMKKAWGGNMPTICVSSTLIPLLEEYGHSDVLGVVPNGKNTNDYFIENRKRDGVGTLFYDHQNKCPEDTIQVLKLLKQKKPNVELYSFGMPILPKELSFVKYTRLPPVGKVRELYNCSKVWFSTSKDEGLPNPILEAMACGTAVVSTDNLGSREVIKDGENGYIVPVGDIDSIVNKIIFLLENEEERRKIVDNGLLTIKKFTWEKSVDSMEQILNELWENRSDK